MYYNLKQFGNTLRDIRKSQGITQKDLNEMVFINQETLRKIENGLVIPKQETLDLLSTALNVDLAEIFLKCRIDSHSNFETLKKELDYHLEDNNLVLLEKDLMMLRELLSTDMNDFFKNKILQLIEMTQGFIYDLSHRDYSLGINTYLKAMHYTIPLFEIESYADFLYTDVELRLLMNIGISKFYVGEQSLAIDILSFCVAYYNNNGNTISSHLIVKIHYNLSYIFHRIDHHQEALTHANLGIQHSVSNRSIVSLAHLYYRKGIAEYHLNMPSYLFTLHYAKNLFETSNQLDLCDKIIQSCKKFYDIDLL